MTDVDPLQEIRARRTAITRGEWTTERETGGAVRVGTDHEWVCVTLDTDHGSGVVDFSRRSANAEFIAHAPADIDALFAALDAAVARADTAEAQRDAAIELIEEALGYDPFSWAWVERARAFVESQGDTPAETVTAPRVRGIGADRPDDAIRQRIEHQARQEPHT